VAGELVVTVMASSNLDAPRAVDAPVFAADGEERPHALRQPGFGHILFVLSVGTRLGWCFDSAGIRRGL
jgi:hypothetical protein